MRTPIEQIAKEAKAKTSRNCDDWAIDHDIMATWILEKINDTNKEQ